MFLFVFVLHVLISNLIYIENKARSPHLGGLEEAGVDGEERRDLEVGR